VDGGTAMAKRVKIPWDFDVEGVDVFLTTNTCNDKYDGRTLRDIKIGRKNRLHYEGPPDIRWVINFYVYYLDDKGQEELIENFHASPMVIKVLQKKGDGNTLHWLDPRDGVAKPLYTVIKEDSNGNTYGYATVFEWGDPNIGW
jgi:hypothetical protein